MASMEPCEIERSNGNQAPQVLLRLFGTSDDVGEFVGLGAIMDPAAGGRLRFYRIRSKLSIKGLAREAGVLPADVRLAERSPGGARVGVLMKIVGVLGISLHDLAEEEVANYFPSNEDKSTAERRPVENE